MDHAEVRELLELAAVEPHGLDRLIAGDTLEAAAVAGHLAGCHECTEELARIRRASIAIRQVIRSTPPADLRDRTLAFVTAVGRARSPAPATMTPRQSPVAASPGRRREGWRIAGWIASLAAAVVVAVAGTAGYVSSTLDAQLAERDALIARQGEAIGGLSRVSTWSLRVSAQPDAEHVALDSTGSDGASGTLLYSASSQELVVVASGLVEPAAGREFRCWVEVDGQRFKIGKMFFGGELAFWAGDAPVVRADMAGAVFGVSLAETANPDDVTADPVMVGDL